MHKILIVDDARLMRNIIKGILAEEMDCTVIEASDGMEAVELYKKHAPDVVTMDVSMERQSGLQAARDILKYDSRANIVVITAIGQEKLLKQCLDAGVRDFITKPFTKDRIRAAVVRSLKGAVPLDKVPSP
jgi:two-component system, chemotaxis family, chemotaxis protein CheY